LDSIPTINIGCFFRIRQLFLIFFSSEKEYSKENKIMQATVHDAIDDAIDRSYCKGAHSVLSMIPYNFCGDICSQRLKC
jgi:hypothetical protein